VGGWQGLGYGDVMLRATILSSVLLLVAPPVWAADEGSTPEIPNADTPAPEAERPWLDAALAAARDRLGSQRPDALALQPRLLTFAGGRRARIRYVLHGHPVVGASLVAASAVGGPLRLDGGAPRWPGPDAAVPAVSAQEALALATKVASVPPWHAELAWWAHDGTMRLAWRVPVQRATSAVPSPHDVWVDAHDGSRLGVVPTGHSSDALLYPQNPVTSEVERWVLPGSELNSSYASAASCSATDPDPTVLELAACEVVEKQAMPDADGHFLFVPRPASPRDPFAEVGAFAHVDLMSHWLDQRWGFRLAWAPIDVYVNFPLANAFFGDFDGDGVPDVSFGHARGADLAYDADVVYHELGHAVVGTLAPDLPFLQADEMGLDWVSGSINEGAADVFAMLLTGDPKVGEYAGLAFGRATAIRDLARPRTCPADLFGEVHDDGEIFGAVFWQMMQDDRIGPDVSGELLMGAIALWDADPSWPKVANSLLVTADDLLLSNAIDEATRGAMVEHLQASGMPGCERVITMEPGDHKELLVFNAGLEGDLERFVGSVQLRVDAVDAPITLRIEKTGSASVGWSAFVRRGAPVEHRALDVAGLGLTAAVPEVYDELIDGSSGGSLTVEPGDGAVYVMLASRNIDLAPLELVSVRLSVDAVSDHRQPPSPPAKPNAIQHEGCSTGPLPAGALSGLLALLCARRRR